MKVKKLKRLVLKEEFVAVTGDMESALILSQLCYWSERVKDFDEFLEEECMAFNGHEQVKKELKMHGWIRKSAAQLSEEMAWAMNGRTIHRYLTKLVEMLIVDKRKQQNPRYRFDHSCEYRVNFCELQKQLKRIGYKLCDYQITDCFEENDQPTGQNDQSTSHKDKSVSHGDQTITEIKIENKTEIKTESNPQRLQEGIEETSAEASGSSRNCSETSPQNKSREKKQRVPKLADQPFLDNLRENNPRVDFDTELRKMDNWLLAHQGRQRTRAFVTNWINRVVDKLPPEDEWRPTTI